MAITFVNKGTFAAAGATSITPGLPASIQTGDLLIVVLNSNDNNAVTLPSGWASAAAFNIGTGRRMTVAWKRHTAGDTALAFTKTGTVAFGGQILAYRGVRTSGNPWDVTPTTTAKTGASTTLTGTGLTTTSAQNMLVFAGIHNLDANSTAQFATWVATTPATLTERADDSSNTGNGTGLGAAEGIKAAAGATGNPQATIASSSISGSVLMALVPAPRVISVGQATETDAAQAITPYKTVSVGQATETDTAEAVTAVQVGIGSSTIVRVQKATPTQSAVGGTTLTITLPNNVQVGNHIIVVMGFSGALGLSASVADQAGNSYTTHVVTDDGNATGAYSAIASAKCTTALTAGQTITMTVTASVTHRMLAAYEYSGLDPTTWFETGSNTGKGTSTSPASGTISPTGANLLVLGAVGYNSGSTLHTATGAWTEIDEVNTSGKGLAVTEQINVAPGSYQNTGTLSSSVLWSSSIAAFKAAPGGGAQKVDVGGASETDTAQAVSRRKARAVGQPGETDTAQPIARRRTRTVAQASEADAAQAVAHLKTRTPGQASETDTAQAVDRRKVRAVAQASETDAAQAVAHLRTHTLGQASETDAAQAVVCLKTRTLGQPSETDTAQAVVVRPLKAAVNQATESDAAQAIAAAKTATVGQATEKDRTPAGHRVPTGELPPTGTCFPTSTVLAIKTVHVGQVAETDAAGPVTAATSAAIGQAIESDTAGAVSVHRTYHVGTAAESDAAQSVGRSKVRALGQATETDTAQGVAASKTFRLGVVVETDVALRLVQVSDAPTVDRPARATLTLRVKRASLADRQGELVIDRRQAEATVGEHIAELTLGEHDAVLTLGDHAKDAAVTDRHKSLEVGG